jgi:hypothetical protein
VVACSSSLYNLSLHGLLLDLITAALQYFSSLAIMHHHSLIIKLGECVCFDSIRLFILIKARTQCDCIRITTSSSTDQTTYSSHPSAAVHTVPDPALVYLPLTTANPATPHSVVLASVHACYPSQPAEGSTLHLDVPSVVYTPDVLWAPG